MSDVALEPFPSAALPAPLIALVGNPNCGKTALFNRLTGARQKVGNYAGVTVERKEGQFVSPAGQAWRVLDLPGAYSLLPATPDEAITRDVIAGTRAGEPSPVGLVCVVDATNLRLNLRMVLELQALDAPMVLVINMMDLARKRGIHIDVARLQAELGVPVIEAVAVRAGGEQALLAQLDQLNWARLSGTQAHTRPMERIADIPVETTHQRVSQLLAHCVVMPTASPSLTAKLDHYALHPVLGPVILAVLMFLVFQAVFSWASGPMDLIDAAMGATGKWVEAHMGEGMLRGLLVDGVIGGAGSVLVFLPQILILFAFILALEDSGYLPRAAFLLDRPRLHPAAVQLCLRHPRHHGHAHHRQSARPVGDHPDRALDDLLGAPAGVCAADRGFHPESNRRRRVQPARAGAVRPVRGRHCVGPARGAGAQAVHEAVARAALADGAA